VLLWPRAFVAQAVVAPGRDHGHSRLRACCRRRRCSGHRRAAGHAAGRQLRRVPRRAARARSGGDARARHRTAGLPRRPPRAACRARCGGRWACGWRPTPTTRWPGWSAAWR
jgi:hypothetical protein